MCEGHEEWQVSELSKIAQKKTKELTQVYIPLLTWDSVCKGRSLCSGMQYVDRTVP